MITQSELINLVSYNKQTGEMARKRNNSKPNLHNKGYLQFSLANKNYLVHRLAWVYVNGAIPDGMMIDHIDGNKLNNRIENLRVVTNSQNMQNRNFANSNSKTGILGVVFHPRTGKWKALIRINGRQKTIGSFGTKNDAQFAYAQEKRVTHPFWQQKM